MPKKIRVAINGFGRIGRNTLKAGFGKSGIEWVAVNDLTDAKTLAHLLKYDSVYGEYKRRVSSTKKEIVVDGQPIKVFSEREPSNLPWKELKIDVVLECTGIFRDEESAGGHLKAGAKRVIISAPSKGGNVPTYVLGVNAHKYKKSQKIIDNASCTTNCVAPVAAIMHAKFGIKKAVMTTIHAYTADQNLVDGPHKDLRRARAAGVNIVPTTTGAAISTAESIPALRGKFDGFALRVPVPVGSLSDFTFLLKRKTTVEEVNNVFKKMARHPFYKGILAVTDRPIVSTDVIGNSYSAIVDLELTKVIDGDLVKVVAWYDNEWGYSHRLAELAREVGRKI